MSRSISLFDCTPAQRRMILQSLIGKRAHLLMRDSGPFDAEIVAVAGRLDGRTPDKMTELVVKATGEDDRYMVLEQRNIHSVEELPWPLSDRRHPAWEPPLMRTRIQPTAVARCELCGSSERSMTGGFIHYVDDCFK